MKIPKRISELLIKKQAFIDTQRLKMENSVVKLQGKLLSDILSELIPELDVKDGLIQDTPKNYKLISILDKTYKDFQKISTQSILPQIINTTSKIAGLAEGYFSVMLSGDLPAKFNKIIESTSSLTNARLGLEGSKMVRGGYLESFFNSNTIGTDLKQMTAKAVTSNMNIKDYTKLLSEKISGTEEYTGALERQFERYAYDIYQQYDASYNKTIGSEFGFTYFIYQGGLIGDSRDFCAAHNNKVWSIEEAQSWATWTPSKGDYPAGYAVKSKSPYAVPSYLGYPGYDPLIDRGGYNCRHALGWIPDEMALSLRPDLK